MASHAKWTGIVLLLALCIVPPALALRAPAADPSAPGPRASQVTMETDPLDPVTNGFVNRSSGVLASLIAQHEGPFDGTPEQAARAYLADRAGEFGLGKMGSDLLLQMVQEAPGGLHVRFQQGVGTIPVWRADVVVSLDADGRYVSAVHSSYDPILARSAATPFPVIDASRARDLAIAAVGIVGEPKWLGEPPAPALWMLREEDRVGSPATLAWRVSVPVDQPLGDWEVFVDAASGTVLRLVDQACYTDGSGYAFDPDPLTSAGVAYGGVYSDPGGTDADTAELNAQRFLKTLPELTLVSGLYYLRGPWCYIDEFEAPTSAPVSNADPNAFNYTRNQQGFEDVNVYWQIDNNQRYIQLLGFNNIQHGPIHIDTHGLSGADNSHYIPSSNRIAYGEGGVDDAEDADVVLHEYGHAIQSSSVPGWGSGGHESAMGEGFGDYWATSYSASLYSFRQEWVFNWDGHNPFWGGRVVNSTQTYLNWSSDIYASGTIWASCLTLIRQEIGRTACDSDVLRHHFFMGTSATAPQAAGYMLQADKVLYNGLHAGSIDYWFVTRKFLAESAYDVPVLTHTPLADQTGAGPYPITVTIASTSAITAGSVKVLYGTGTAFDQELVLNPTGNPNEWGGDMPDMGGNVTIRYYIIADNAATWRGASPRGADYQYHDYQVGPLAAVEELGGARTLALLPASPNPFSAGTTLRFDLPASGPVDLSIYDVNGRMVRTIESGNVVAGRHAYPWDGRDNSGHELSSGLYFVRFEAQGQSFSKKLLLTK
jgi:zinc metalloprotease ZmpB